jgi:hypothetical protein
MSGASSSNPSSIHPRVLGSIRKADPRDAAELSRLFDLAFLAPGLAPLEVDGGHWLVLDLDGSLRAAEYVVLDVPRSRAHLQLLVVDNALGPSVREVEDRMIGVALALCEAYGCTDVDIVASSRAMTIDDRRVIGCRAIRAAG